MTRNKSENQRHSSLLYYLDDCSASKSQLENVREKNVERKKRLFLKGFDGLEIFSER